jgi:hypothetical protein
MTFAVFLIGLAMQAPPTPHYRILSDCDPSSEVRAEIAKNTPMEIRFSIAQSPTCYSVTATVDGKHVSGYVLDRNLDAIETFEKARVTAERDAFSAPLPLPSVLAPASSSSAPAIIAPEDAGKEESKPSNAPVKKGPAKDSALKKTPTVDF